jgi:hypothetical protein
MADEMHEYQFDVPATTTARVRAVSKDAALDEIGEMRMLNWDLTHRSVVITELSLDSDAADLVEVDGKMVDSVRRDEALVQLPQDVLAEFRALVAAVRAAAEGDSNDAEIEAGADLADYVDQVCGMAEKLAPSVAHGVSENPHARRNR